MATNRWSGRMLDALRRHWPEYVMEAGGFGMVLISAGTFCARLEYPGSPAHQAIADPFLRRILMGTAMGLTAIGIIYSPWGKQSGAHINPSVTLTFFRLGKIEPWDALFYIAAQFAGGGAGGLLVTLSLGPSFAAPPRPPCPLCRDAPWFGRTDRRIPRRGRDLLLPHLRRAGDHQH